MDRRTVNHYREQYVTLQRRADDLVLADEQLKEGEARLRRRLDELMQSVARYCLIERQPVSRTY